MCASITSWYLHNCNGRTQSIFPYGKAFNFVSSKNPQQQQQQNFSNGNCVSNFFVFEFFRRRRKKNWISVWHRFFVYCVFFNFTASFSVCIEIPMQSDSQSSCSWLFCTLVLAPSSVVIKTIFSMSFFFCLFLLIPMFINECNKKRREKNGFASDHSRQNKTNCATNAQRHGFPAHTVRARLELTLYFSTHLCFTSLPVSYVFSIHIYTYALSLFSKRASHLWPK